MEKDNWVIELTEVDDEYWNPDAEGYATKEEAIKDGMTMAKENGLKSFRIGRRVDVTIPLVYADDFIDKMAEQLYDNVGEFAEDYLNDVSDEDEKELEEQLNKVFEEWSIKHKYIPNCFNIYDDKVIYTNFQENTLDWEKAKEHLKECEAEYTEIGSAGSFALNYVIRPLRDRFNSGERTLELYDEILRMVQ